MYIKHMSGRFHVASARLLDATMGIDAREMDQSNQARVLQEFSLVSIRAHFYQYKVGSRVCVDS